MKAITAIYSKDYLRMLEKMYNTLFRSISIPIVLSVFVFPFGLSAIDFSSPFDFSSINLQSLNIDIYGDGGYKKATDEGDDVVKNKLFTKKGKLEISSNFGMILNQSYISSLVSHSSFSYFVNETWGFSLEGLYSLNSDKSERYCIEHFYNNYENNVGVSCPSEGDQVDLPLYVPGEVDAEGHPIIKKGASFGPAYVAIRELQYIVTGSAIWNPIYGKQLLLLKNTMYFDIFVTMGLGVAVSTFYPEQTILKNGNLSRGDAPSTIPDDCRRPLPGVCPTEENYENYIGVKGRPEPENQLNGSVTLGIGQKVHFWQDFNIKFEIRNYSLLGTHNKFETFFMTWLGLGYRF